jgi:hypothetical protein
MWNIESYKVSWREAAEIFRKDLGLLLLISLRTLGSLYRSLSHAWFLPLAFLVGLVLSLPLLVGSFYVVLLVRAARPSIEEKHRKSYWHKILFTDWYLFFGVALVGPVSQYLASQELYGATVLSVCYDLLLRLFFLSGRFWLPGSQTLGSMILFLSPLVILVVLFLLDAQQSIWAQVKAVGRALLMFVYNYPFFFLIYLLLRIILFACYLVAIPVAAYFPQCGLLGWIFFVLVGYPYYVAVLTNFYVKRLHDQFSWYYWRTA